MDWMEQQGVMTCYATDVVCNFPRVRPSLILVKLYPPILKASFIAYALTLAGSFISYP